MRVRKRARERCEKDIERGKDTERMKFTKYKIISTDEITIKQFLMYTKFVP